MSDASLSERLARYGCSLVIEELSEAQIEHMKVHFLDWLGAVYAGRDQKPIRLIVDVADGLGGNAESTRIPDGSKTTCLWASLINSASSCLMEIDDLHRESIFHPGSVVIPATLAAAERAHASGKDLILGMVAGYEVGIRIALGVGLSHYDHWHTTATCGAFAAAAGAAKVLKLDPEGSVWALGSAGTQAAGLWEFLVESAMSKPLHIGKAAMNGLLSALLAERGFTGARRILEGEKGFFRATSHDYDEERCLKGLGTESFFDRTSLKIYASCGHTHPAIDAVLMATGGHGMASGEIERVDVHVYQAALDLLGNVQPTTPTQAKFHLPFCVATAARYANVGSEHFRGNPLDQSELREAMARVHLHVSPELTRMYPRKWASRVAILTRDGRRLEGFCEHPKGDPERPLTTKEIVGKFEDLTQGALSPSSRERLADRIFHLENVKDVAELLTL
jgi:2-methylcitrate dehydratase PrpD